MTRRRLVVTLVLAGLALPARAQKLDLSSPDDNVKAFRKIQASLVDGKPVVFWFQGNVYSRVPGEVDRHLFTYQAMNIRAAHTVRDPEKGYGFRLVSREVLFYMDPKTREVLKTWKNPWTGQEVEVFHIANDPVNRAPMFAKGAQGPYTLGATFREGTGIYSAEVPLFYPSPLGGDYQPFVGGTYQAIELFNFFFPEAELLSPGDEVASATVSWCRVSQWLPWMEMGARVGQLIFNGAGRRVPGYDALPEVVRREIEAGYPEYKTPPSADDARPNETSWTYFKKRIDAKRKAAAPAK